MTVTVVGVSASSTLSASARDAVANADLLVGSGANLDLAQASGTVERLELGPLAPALERLRGHRGHAVVVASGDPGFFGIVRSLREAELELLVLPAVSSVAAAFAVAGLPWDAAVVVSAHGRELRPALNACRAFPFVAVLTGPDAGPHDIATGLAGWQRDLVICERLGLPGETVTRLPAAEALERTFATPNVVLSIDPTADPSMRQDNQAAAAPATGWALDESAYEHRDSMITKAEVRAYAVARLRPRLGRLVLDIGAGSGSVGIECARLGAAVIAIERDAEACQMIARNATRHEAMVRVVNGSAPAALAGLPEADAAFVGGGGLAAVRAVVDRRVPTVVAAFAALDHVLAAHTALRTAGYTVTGTQLSAARLADLPRGSLRLAATNPVIVLTAELS